MSSYAGHMLRGSTGSSALLITEGNLKERKHMDDIEACG
jgi:hypothetical protein